VVARQNVLLAVVDCLRADAVHGPNRTSRTPALDALAARGQAFPQAIASATTTLPSFASLLSGVFPANTGVRTHVKARLERPLSTLPEHLRAVGYHTYATVTGPLLALSGLDRGFDVYDVRPVDDFVHGAAGERILSDLASLPEPWFALVHMFEVHGPRQTVPGAVGRTVYDRAVSSIDGYIDRLVRAAKDATIVLTGDHGELVPAHPVSERLFDNRAVQGTVKRYVSPRFTHRPPPLFYGHGVYPVDDLLRVPLIVAGPGVPAGGTHPQQVRHVDIAPTILDLLGITGLEARDGASLTTTWTSKDEEDRVAFADVGKVVHDDGGWCVVARRPPLKAYRFPARGSRSLVVERDGRRLRRLDGDARALVAELDAYAGRYLSDDQAPQLSAHEEAELRQRLERIGYL
jgi:arylsulfatase A-like enzyme